MIGLAVGQIWPIRPLFSLLVLYVILLEIVCWMDGNRHAADRLHELRAKIRTLEAEADELRLYLQQNPHDLEGDEYYASIGSYRRRYVDWEGLEREIGKAVLGRYTAFRLIPVVRLRERREREVA